MHKAKMYSDVALKYATTVCYYGLNGSIVIIITYSPRRCFQRYYPMLNYSVDLMKRLKVAF